MKFEKENSRCPQLRHEYKVYRELVNCHGFCCVSTALHCTACTVRSMEHVVLLLLYKGAIDGRYLCPHHTHSLTHCLSRDHPPYLYYTSLSIPLLSPSYTLSLLTSPSYSFSSPSSLPPLYPHPLPPSLPLSLSGVLFRCSGQPQCDGYGSDGSVPRGLVQQVCEEVLSQDW